MAKPWEQNWDSPQGGVVRRPVDPYKPAAERRADEDQALQREANARETERLRIAQEGQNLQGQGQQFTQGNARFDNLAQQKDKFNALQAVKDYKAVLPLLMSGLKSAPNPQGDNALIYAYAKVMDPGSVVRESEGQMASNTASFWDAKVEQFKKNFGYDDARGLPAGAAAGLRAEMNRKVASLAKAYGSERLNAQEFAKANGLPPEQVVGRSPAEPFTQEYLKLMPGAREQDAAPDFSKAGTGPATALDANARYSTDEDKRNTALFNAAFKGGASLDDLQSLAQKISGAPLTKEQVDFIAARDRGEKVGDFAVTKTGDPSAVQQITTGALENPWTGPVAGAALGAVNQSLGGIPAALAGDEASAAMRDANPWSTAVGELGGGILGTMGVGKALGAMAPMAGGAAKMLANPLTADVLFGAGSGAVQSDDPVTGALLGGGLSTLGGYVGGKIGQGAATRAATRDAMEAVPTTDQLRQMATDKYAQAEANGITADPTQTTDLRDTIASILQSKGTISPTGRVSEVHPKVREALSLSNDYAGSAMTPVQMQTVRSIIGDAASSAEPKEAMIGKSLLNEFDNWAAPLAPELADARSIASRYLGADELEKARSLAEANASMYSGSGMENALRNQYRSLDKGIISGKERGFNSDVVDAIMNVSRGNPMSNALRMGGKLAPTGIVSAGLGSGVPFAIGSALGGPGLGAAMSAGTMGLGAASRYGATKMTDSAANLAEVLARNGGALPSVDIAPFDIDNYLVAGILAQLAPELASEENQQP